MKGNKLIVIKEEVFKGNLLDIGMENYGVIYNAYKCLNQEISVDYLDEKEEGTIRHGYYDNCILLLSLSKIFLEKTKLRLIKEVSTYLNENGILYIWDIDKKIGKVWVEGIKIQTPDNKIKDVKIMDLNLLRDNSKENTLKLLSKHYDVIDFSCEHGVYYIKANKKREKEKHENCFGCG
ncbi:MAG: class I SAM-dependent methyltransferase [Solirubrobacterales bacterium]